MNCLFCSRAASGPDERSGVHFSATRYGSPETLHRIWACGDCMVDVVHWLLTNRDKIGETLRAERARREELPAPARRHSAKLAKGQKRRRR